MNNPYLKRLLGEKEDPTCALLQRHNIRSPGPLRQSMHRTTENPTSPEFTLFVNKFCNNYKSPQPVAILKTHFIS